MLFVVSLFSSWKGQVSIAQIFFDPATAGGVVAFLLEMYNLAAIVKTLVEHLDKAKKIAI